MPDRNKNSQLLRSIWGISRCVPVTKTIPQAMTSTTTVRMAVPRLDSTFSTPILPKMEVRLANTAERKAYTSHAPLRGAVPVPGFLAIINRVPAPMPKTPSTCGRDTGSPKNTKASKIVSTVLDLSMGATLFTSPSCSALK